MKENDYILHPSCIIYRNKAKNSHNDKKKYIDSYLQNENIKFRKLTEDDILFQIANLNQLTFEVTDACNLKCKYCTYGDLYSNYDNRNDKLMDFNTAKIIIDYLIDLWNSNLNQSNGKDIHISFYGGEPLLNINFIKNIVSYFNTLKSKNNIVFSMTTNGVLLKKQIKYLVDNNFKLLISLDGDHDNNSYRVFHNNENSFYRVKSNLDFIKNTYPDFFRENVNFNSVLQNRNSIFDVFTFFENEFQKTPRINSLNNTGIKKDQIDNFNLLFKDQTSSLRQSKNIEKIRKALSTNLSEVMDISIFISKYSGNVFQNYNELFVDDIDEYYLTPTGTCLPFSKKIFITVNGKILPCERIGHQFFLGSLDSNGLHINFQDIANKYNKYYDKILKQCTKCYRKKICIQCIYNLVHNEEDSINCPFYLNSSEFNDMIDKKMRYISKNKYFYPEFLNDIIIQF